MKKYSSYKDSGIKWLGNIPSHWEVKRLKTALKERKEQFSNEPLIILSLMKDTGVIPYDEKGDIGNKSKTDISQYKIARKGDLVVNSMNVIIGSVGISKYDGYISPAYYAFIPKDDICLSYYNYLLSLRAVQQSIRCYSKGIMEIRLRISSNDFLSMPFPFPPLDEQKAIVTYLNSATSKIDKAIAQQQQMIDLLNERKQIIINQAVTKGLNSNVKMKDSENPWIGEMPGHWNRCQLKRKAKIILGKMLSNKTTNQYDYICAKNVQYDGLDISDLKKMYFSEQEKEIFRVKQGDMLLAEGGTGGCAIFNYDRENVFIQNSVMIIRCNGDLLNDYLCLFVQAISKKGYIDFACNKVTIPHFTKEKVGAVVVPIPQLNEQIEIIKYVEQLVNAINTASEFAKKRISLLQERKQIIINEAVTGKIKI